MLRAESVKDFPLHLKDWQDFLLTITAPMETMDIFFAVISESILILLTMTFLKLNLEKLLQMKGC